MNFNVGDLVSVNDYRGSVWLISGPAGGADVANDHWWLNRTSRGARKGPDRIERFSNEISLFEPAEEPVDECAAFFS